MGKTLRRSVAGALLLLAGCADYPRDIGGTLDRIERSGELRVGYAALRPGDRTIARAFVSRIEQATGARARSGFAPAERQLAMLEHGSLDLVLGEFADDTPWLSEVAVLEPLTVRREGDRRLGLAPVAANGENRWIMLLEREARDLREQAR